MSADHWCWCSDIDFEVDITKDESAKSTHALCSTFHFLPMKLLATKKISIKINQLTIQFIEKALKCTWAHNN